MNNVGRYKIEKTNNNGQLHVMETAAKETS